MVQEIVEKHGAMFDAAFEGRLFHAATAKTGVAPGTDIGTTAAFALHNPTGSGKLLIIRKASLGYVSGTLGAGAVYHCVNSNPAAAAPTGTAIVEIPGLLNVNAPVGIALTTATLAAAPAIVRPFCNLTALLASTAVGVYQATEDLEGAIVLPEGCTYSLQAVAAAGSTPLVVYGVTWEENAREAA